QMAVARDRKSTHPPTQEILIAIQLPSSGGGGERDASRYYSQKECARGGSHSLTSTWMVLVPVTTKPGAPGTSSSATFAPRVFTRLVEPACPRVRSIARGGGGAGVARPSTVKDGSERQTRM